MWLTGVTTGRCVIFFTLSTKITLKITPFRCWCFDDAGQCMVTRHVPHHTLEWQTQAPMMTLCGKHVRSKMSCVNLLWLWIKRCEPTLCEDLSESYKLFTYWNMLMITQPIKVPKDTQLLRAETQSSFLTSVIMIESFRAATKWTVGWDCVLNCCVHSREWTLNLCIWASKNKSSSRSAQKEWKFEHVQFQEHRATSICWWRSWDMMDSSKTTAKIDLVVSCLLDWAWEV